jgi:hypothetical protein
VRQFQGLGRVTDHEPQDPCDIEQAADVSVWMRNSQNAARFVRRIEGTDQFAHAARVDVGEAPQVQQDPALATEKKSLDAVAQLGVHWHSKGALNFNDRFVGAWFECGRHNLSSHRISLASTYKSNQTLRNRQVRLICRRNPPLTKDLPHNERRAPPWSQAASASRASIVAAVSRSG